MEQKKKNRKGKMKYICEIEAAFNYAEQWVNEECCSSDCNYLDKKSSKGDCGYSWKCSLFNTPLKRERPVPYEIPGIMRCKVCRDIFYPAQETQENKEV
jgi:hypothetical protein